MALTVAMSVHELCTNAVKYGALSVPTGKVLIGWTEEETSEGLRLRLEWRESGGPPVAAPTTRGFGSRLIERQLAREFDGEVRLAFHQSGVTCVFVAPLENDPLPVGLSTQGVRV